MTSFPADDDKDGHEDMQRTLLSFRPDNSGTRDTRHETRQTPGPPSQDLTSGWKQPESDNYWGHQI